MRREQVEEVLATVVDISALQLSDTEQLSRLEVSGLQRQRALEELDRKLEVGLREQDMRLVYKLVACSSRWRQHGVGGRTVTRGQSQPDSRSTCGRLLTDDSRHVGDLGRLRGRVRGR